MALEVAPSDLGRLRSELETAIFRIVQEALTNMFRHSGARNAGVTIMQKTEILWLRFVMMGKG